MTDEWPITMWYSTLGVGDGHDHATRGYLDALRQAGYEGLRLPPSGGSPLLRLDAEVEPDLERFRELLQPPKPMRLPPLKRIEEGDPRIGQPRKHYGNLGGDPVHQIPPLDPERNVVAVGDVDLEAYQTSRDEHGGVFAAGEAFSADMPMRVRTIVMHHDPGSIVRHYTALARMGRPEGVGLVGITVWEADRIKAAVAQILSELDALVVPSEHSKRALLVSGLDAPCEVVPHAFDPKSWPRPEPREPGEPFGFYAIATPIARKNLLGLLTAYFRAFDDEKYRGRVMLVLKTSGDRGKLQSLVDDAKACAYRERESHRWARLKIHLARWPTSMVRRLHFEGDCYVSATRGEGFGLCEAEAALSGNRVITTDFGAAPEVLQRAGGVASGTARGEGGGDHGAGPYRTGSVGSASVAHDLVPCQLASVPTEMAEYGPYAENQQWADPDIEALGELMRRAWEERRPRDPEQWDHLMPWLRTDVVGHRLKEVLVRARERALEEDW